MSVSVRVGGEIADVLSGSERGARLLEQEHCETSVGRQVLGANVKLVEAP
jgi:hypothetical protein